ncbi:MAG TPA: ABC transporter permease [Actinomycetota bacterium]|jgi:ABC transporter DrrB family efflux protein|nr:ABC transporter permease [Actinomycetota bacterium]
MAVVAVSPGNHATLPTSTLVIAKRSLLKFMRTPQLVVLETIQGALFLLIFRYVFGGAIGIEGVSYVNFLVPGFVLTSILFSGMTAAAGVAEDLEQGFVDRLRSLPIPRSAVLAGRVFADTASVSWGLLVTTAVGFAVGFRLTGSVTEGLAAFALCVVFGFALGWLFLFIGLVAGNAQAAQGMSLMIIPFTFVSSAFVPVESMPGWLQALGNNQPITFMVDAVRALTLGSGAESILGHSAGYFVVRALLWAAALVVVFGALAVARYRKV